MTASITRLRRAAAQLRASGDPDAAWLASGIEQYEAGAAGGATLDGVLELSRSSGAGPWWVAEARQRRDVALLELRDVAFADLAVQDAAAEISRTVRRRTTARNPARTKAEALADRVLMTGCRMPAPKQVVRIIKGSRTSAPHPECPGLDVQAAPVGGEP